VGALVIELCDTKDGVGRAFRDVREGGHWNDVKSQNDDVVAGFVGREEVNRRGTSSWNDDVLFSTQNAVDCRIGKEKQSLTWSGRSDPGPKS
jgi:hypothetical protein